MWSLFRGQPQPVRYSPQHRRDWRRLWWRHCRCGDRWPCPDRFNPPPLVPPYPMARIGANLPPRFPRKRPTNRGPTWRHLPLRPLWICRGCGHPWPCATARLTLLSDYREDRVGLHVYLGSALYAATADLHRLNPNPGPDPAALHARFLGWVRPRP
ncbi:hypothetical protein [Plantactinospora sp. ZYX-F-223]|uniref:hypothetical protein n=1 Tax=Plantactinospora sp. ZYX-F-223 TaxID=3144103 RepID=UPI0031FE228A